MSPLSSLTGISRRLICRGPQALVISSCSFQQASRYSTVQVLDSSPIMSQGTDRAKLESHPGDETKGSSKLAKTVRKLPASTSTSCKTSSTLRKVAPSPSFICQPCNRSFGSSEALVAHSLHSLKHLAKVKSSNASVSTKLDQTQKTDQSCNTRGELFESKCEPETQAHDEKSGPTNPLPDLGLWTTIPPPNYEQTLKSIRDLCHPTDMLKKAQYSFTDHPAALQYAAHCQHCGASEKGIKETNRPCTEPHTTHTILPAQPRPTSEARPYFQAPASPNSPETRPCVALDCEMVELAFGQEALAQLCAIDVLTGEVLINLFVAPPPEEVGRVVDWRTKFTNITAELMAEAMTSKTALESVEAARRELFRFVGAETVLVGHALKNDLEVLGVEHGRVVDSQMLLCRPRKRWKVSLRDACSGLLEREVQNHGNGGDGHVCREDVMAARELVLFYLRHPEVMREWAQVKLWGVRDWKQKKTAYRKKEEVASS